AVAPGTAIGSEPLGGQFISPTATVPAPPNSVPMMPATGGMFPTAHSSAVAPMATAAPISATPAAAPVNVQMPPENGSNPLIQPGAQLLTTGSASTPGTPAAGSDPAAPAAQIGTDTAAPGDLLGALPGQTAGGDGPMKAKNLRMEGVEKHTNTNSIGYKAHGFLDATS